MKFNPFKTIYSLLTHPAGATLLEKLRVVRRYFAWQIISSVDNIEVIFNWLGHTRLKMKKSEAMITHNFYHGIYEYFDTLFLLKYLRSDDNFIDIGANSGVYSVLCGGVLKMRGLAFEPIPSTFRRLQENIFINDISDKVVAINAGVSNINGTLHFTSENDATNHVVEQNNNDCTVIAVPVVTIDDEVARTGIIPNFIKLDVEGYEKFVLDGAVKTLSNLKLNVVLIELNESGLSYGITDLEIYNLMILNGFKAYDYYPNSNTLVSINQKSTRLNTIFIRNYDLCMERISP